MQGRRRTEAAAADAVLVHGPRRQLQRRWPPLDGQFSGTSCGSDVRGPWQLTQTTAVNGWPAGQLGQRPFDLTSGAGGFTILRNSDGSGQVDGQFQVSAGPPAVINMAITLSGGYSGLSVGSPQAQITAKPVASC